LKANLAEAFWPQLRTERDLRMDTPVTAKFVQMTMPKIMQQIVDEVLAVARAADVLLPGVDARKSGMAARWSSPHKWRMRFLQPRRI